MNYKQLRRQSWRLLTRLQKKQIELSNQNLMKEFGALQLLFSPPRDGTNAVSCLPKKSKPNG